MLEAAGEETTVTDVGSTKASVVAAAGGSPRFVGGHPICGHEARGAEHASAGIFTGATWFLTPTAQTDPERHRLVHGFVAELGAVPIAIDPAAHDRLVAMTSHVPHVLANVVVNQAGAARVEGHEPLANAGGSLRDMTRVAGANPRIWVDIFLDNAAAVRDALAEHRRRIEQVEAALEAGDAGFLARWIGEAAENRRRMLDSAYDDAGALHQVRVHIPDRPGVLAAITQALGAERINIEDFELQHISPERGGTVTLLVTGEGEADARRRAARGSGLRRRRVRLTFMKGTGCETCSGTGYKGRAGLYEVMALSPDLRRMILRGASVAELRDQAVQDGMLTLRMDGMKKIERGVTTLEEVVKETAG